MFQRYFIYLFPQFLRYSFVEAVGHDVELQLLRGAGAGADQTGR